MSAKWAKGTGGPSGDEAQNLVPVAFDTAQITSAENRSNPKPGDPAPTLSATGYPHVARPGEGVDGIAVRRLTPLECERLQGFPDGWTTTSNGKPQADAPRYRQCGNAIAVPAGEWVISGVVHVAARDQASGEADEVAA